jgi:N-acylneuraminate cytidylyltransferase
MKISHLVCDFDGVFTTNNVFYDADGTELLSSSKTDGFGLRILNESSISVMILSTEKKSNCLYRAAKLGIPCYHGIASKADFILGYCDKKSLIPDQIAFVGNDLNDLEAFNVVGLKLAPRDSHPMVLCAADFILPAKGGKGAFRSACEFLSSFNRFQ